MNDQRVQIVIKINLGASITPKDYQTISNILFGRRYKTTPEIQTLVKLSAIATRTKMTLKDNEDNDEILIFWRYYDNFTTLKRFESDMISLYQKGNDRKFDILNRNKDYLLIGTNTVRILNNPELMYLKTQVESYLDHKKALGEVEILCKS